MQTFSLNNTFIIPRIVNWLNKSSVVTVVVASFVLLGIIGALDISSGVIVTMAPFYLIPIALIALRFERISALAMSLVSGFVWVILDSRYFDTFSPWPDLWNIAMRVGVFVLFALVLSRIKRDIMTEIQLNDDLQAALNEVKQLSGLLPICAWCKRIRDEDGNWEPMETYITVHSEADFTHGICPDCAKKYHTAPQE
jgi:hypothetical protein